MVGWFFINKLMIPDCVVTSPQVAMKFAFTREHPLTTRSVGGVRDVKFLIHNTPPSWMNGREKGKFLRIIFINQLFISILFEIMILYTEIRQASAAVGANWNCMLTISPSEESGLLYKNVILLPSSRKTIAPGRDH